MPGVDTCSAGCGRAPEHRQAITFDCFDGACTACVSGFLDSPEGRMAQRATDFYLGRYLRKMARRRAVTMTK